MFKTIVKGVVKSTYPSRKEGQICVDLFPFGTEEKNGRAPFYLTVLGCPSAVDYAAGQEFSMAIKARAFLNDPEKYPRVVWFFDHFIENVSALESIENI